MTSGYFYCKKCDIKFKGEYNPQQRPRRSCPTCHKSCDLTKPKKKNSIPPQNTPSKKNSLEALGRIIDTIEDPVSFATAHIFKQMIDTKDVRWAQLYVQVLDKTNKLDFNSIREQEWSNQAKRMSMKELVERVAKKGSISRSTLRRLDSLEDTSPYENI